MHRHVEMGEEAVGHTVRERLAKPARVGEARQHRRHQLRAGAFSAIQPPISADQRAIHRGERFPTTLSSNSIRYPSGPSSSSTRRAGLLLAHARAAPGNPPGDRHGRDHVDLLRGPDARGRHAHTQRGLDQQGEAGSAARRRSMAPRVSSPSSPESASSSARGSSPEVDAGLTVGQALQQGRHLQQRVVAHPRDRGVPGDPLGGQGEAEHALLGTAHPVQRRPSSSNIAPALVDQHVAADLVGVSSVSHCAPRAHRSPRPLPPPPAARPGGAASPRARAAAPAASAAAWPFMSSAPRPHTQPSARSPDQGSCDHSPGSASTVSRVTASRVSARRAWLRSRRHEVRARRLEREQLALEARLARAGPRSSSCASRSLPGG